MAISPSDTQKEERDIVDKFVIVETRLITLYIHVGISDLSRNQLIWGPPQVDCVSAIRLAGYTIP